MRGTANIKCPTCGKRGDWFAGEYGPFCSRQCKLVDLGKWFGEEHRISQPLRDEHLEHIEDVPDQDKMAGNGELADHN